MRFLGERSGEKEPANTESYLHLVSAQQKKSLHIACLTPESGMIKARIRFVLRLFINRKKKQMACKPGSVRMANAKLDDYSSGTAVTSCLMRPTRTSLTGSPVLTKQLCP